MQDSTIEALADKLVAGVSRQLREVALWLVEYEQADLRQLEQGVGTGC